MSGFKVAKVVAYNPLTLRGLAEDTFGDVVRFSLPQAPYKSPVGTRLSINEDGTVHSLGMWAEATKSQEKALSSDSTLVYDCE